MSRPWAYRVIAAVLVAAALVGARQAGLGEVLSLESLARHRAVLAAYVGDHALAARAIYVVAYAAAVGLSLPGAAVLTVSGGFLFGAWQGTALTAGAATLGATAIFVLARRLFGEDALARLGPRAERLAAGVRRHQVSYLLVLRLVPLFPFFLVNLVPAFAGIGLLPFVLTTLFGILPATAVFSLAGAGLHGVLDAGGTFELGAVLTPQIVAALFGLAALSLLAIPLRRRFAADG